MRPNETPRSLDEHLSSHAERITRLEKRDTSAPFQIYVQPDEPVNAGHGAFWFDTDDPVPT